MQQYIYLASAATAAATHHRGIPIAIATDGAYHAIAQLRVLALLGVDDLLQDAPLLVDLRLPFGVLLLHVLHDLQASHMHNERSVEVRYALASAGQYVAQRRDRRVHAVSIVLFACSHTTTSSAMYMLTDLLAHYPSRACVA